MATGPGDGLEAAGRGHLRASHADREQVVGVLKVAFVQGRLTKDELDLRVGQVLAARTYADLAAVTADIPAGLAVAQPPQPPRAQDEIMQRPGRMMAVATALYAGVWAFTFLPPWPENAEGDPPRAIIFLFFMSAPVYLLALLVGVVNLVALWREKRSAGQSPGRPASGTGGQASSRLPSADPGSQLPPGDDGYWHATEFAPIVRPRLLPN
jgi:hypothetical protein